MLIKLNGHIFVNPERIEAVSSFNNLDCYTLQARMIDGKFYDFGLYETYEESEYALNKLADKLNAAQGFEVKEEEEMATMSYEPSTKVHQCSCCKKKVQTHDEWYRFCPWCGRRIKRWE